MNRAACTIVSPNYLAYAYVLAESYLRAHPGHRFFVLIVANLTDATPFSGHGFEPVMLGEIGVANLHAEAMKYDILELNTNVKPAFMLHLLAKHGLDTLVYLDPDIFVYSPLSPVFEALDAGASAVLTPHMTTPVWDGKQPGEQDLLFNGTYNLGFVAVSGSEESRKLLSWWDVRCLEAGFSEGRTGLFVDQKWMNLVPGLFADVFITRDAGLNMAYWNLHERRLMDTPEGFAVENPVSGLTPLRFYHFSGVVVTDEAVLSKHTNRFTLAGRPDVVRLFAEYKAAVRAAKVAVAKAEALPYGFDALTDGTTVTRLARRLYAAHQKHFVGSDPFDSNGAFAAFAKEQKLVAGVVAPAKETWKDFNPRDRRVDMVHKLLGWALKLVGPHKYELLMRYLGHISVLRNQSVFLRDSRWPEEGK
ncbi:MAG: group 1 glycosyl transferase [Acidobacteriaceae bacterium]|nr:group 1 glycosyl transferase [Acidobacteriaceae bacterium]